MGVSEKQQNFHFGVEYPFNSKQRLKGLCSKIHRKNINMEAVDLRAKPLKSILQLASYSII